MRYSAIALTIVAAVIITINLYRNDADDHLYKDVQSGTIVTMLSASGGRSSGGITTYAAMARTKEGEIVPIKDLSATLNKCWKLHTVDFKSQPSTLGGIEYIYIKDSCRPS
jgi:hypothetical protein